MYRYHQYDGIETARLIAFAVHGIAFALIFFYLEEHWLRYSASAAITLAAWLDDRRLIRQENIRLRVDPLRRGIEIERAGQPYFYSKYKVYQTRWFAILRLVDQPEGRTLILNSGSFSSPESYRRLRFELRRLERDHAA